MCRSLYAIKHGIKHHNILHQSKKLGVATVHDCDLQDLRDRGIDVIIFDFDGVLAAHGDIEPQADTLTVLQHSLSVFGDNHVFILSNKPLKAREQFFQKHLPAIQFIYAKRKKPYPDGLLQICETAGCEPKQAALIDDRLLTGGLATCIAGTKMIYINKPLQNFRKRFVAESFFQCLRVFERLFF